MVTMTTAMELAGKLDTARAENQRLRNALVLIAKLKPDEYAPGKDARCFARAALEPGSQFPCLSSADP